MLTLRHVASFGLTALLSLAAACSPDDGNADSSGTGAAGGEPPGSGGSSSGGEGGETSTGGGSANTGGSGSGGEQSGESGELQDRSLQLYTEYCRRLFECPVTNDDSAWLRAMFETPEECGETFTSLTVRGLMGPYAQGLAAGRMVLSDEKLTLALERLSTCQGFTITEGLHLRDVFFEGTAELGEPCSIDQECAGNSYCAAATNACGGTCAARLPSGTECEKDLACDSTTVPSACGYDDNLAEQVCMPLFGAAVGAGEPCADPTADTGTHLCPEGYWCDLESGATPVCREPFAADEECFGGDAACEPGYVCGRNAGTWRCMQPLVVSEVDAPCDGEDATVEEYGFCNSFLGLYCEAGKCKSYLNGDIGAPCVGVDIIRSMSCKPDLYCDSTDKCAPLLPDGAACESDSECEGRCDDKAAERKCMPAVCAE